MFGAWLRLNGLPLTKYYPSYARRSRFIIVAVTFLFFLYFLSLFSRSAYSASRWPPPLPPRTLQPTDAHPISHLIHDARRNFQKLLSRRSFTVEEAATRYRDRRGRHPPPGFGIWFAQASKDGAIIVEEFFDRIYHDLNPFWALDPKQMRQQAHAQPQMVQVRNGAAKFITDNPKREPWIQLWAALVKEMKQLPDLDMAVNIMDETRVLVPWETINEYVKIADAKRELIDPKLAIKFYTSLTGLDNAPKETFDFEWVGDEASKYWNHLRAACPPGSPGRNVTALSSFSDLIEYPVDPPPYMPHGFVQNFTASQDPCLQPHLRGMHGTFIESVSMSTTHQLIPLFGGSKLPQNNEILIPGGMYLSDRKMYSGGGSTGSSWSGKKDAFVWRGTASGGRNKEDNWWHFHRHRFVEMMNGTKFSAMQAGDKDQGRTFDVLPNDGYSLPENYDIGTLLSNHSDVAFVHLECYNRAIWKDKTCPYTGPFLSLGESMSMKKQYSYKFLPDVDGNSYSARWRAFLRSTSVPLKATIYAEWHDDRIIPWVHFVPFDSSYRDIYAIMDYFINGHDSEAETIAYEGSEWSKKAYRREDMKLYVWRLLLEYARVVDDNRDYLAFVDDL